MRIIWELVKLGLILWALGLAYLAYENASGAQSNIGLLIGDIEGVHLLVLCKLTPEESLSARAGLFPDRFRTDGGSSRAGVYLPPAFETPTAYDYRNYPDVVGGICDR